MLQPYFLLIKIYFFILKSSVSLRFIFMLWVKLGLNLHYVNHNFQMFKLDLEKAEEPEIKLPTSTGSSKKQETSRKTSTSALLTTAMPLTVWIITNCGKCLKKWEFLRWEDGNHLPPEKSVCRSRDNS